MRSDRPTNLTEKAIREFEAILDRSAREFGADHAQEFRLRLYARCNDIAAGLNLGHTRSDLPTPRQRRFTTVPPIVIAYNPKTRRVVGVVDGRRDLAKLLR